MLAIDITAIILASLGMIGGWITWWLDRRKRKQETAGLKADNLQKEMNLSKDYVSEWRTYIAEPLQQECSSLRQEVTALRHAIQRIDSCSHRDSCPVIGELRKHPEGDER